MKKLTSPRPEQVIAIRENVRRTRKYKGWREDKKDNITTAQDYCAWLLHTVNRVFRQWESGERSMHPAFWELLKIKSKD